jgi:uncharacterized protein (TIGR03437 family)
MSLSAIKRARLRYPHAGSARASEDIRSCNESIFPRDDLKILWLSSAKRPFCKTPRTLRRYSHSMVVEVSPLNLILALGLIKLATALRVSFSMLPRIAPHELLAFAGTLTRRAIGRGTRETSRSIGLRTGSVYVMSFMTTCLIAQQSPVNLGGAGNFVILSKTGITDVPPSPIVGNIGASPITGAAILLTCAEVTGSIYSVDAAGPAPCSLINPILLGAAIVDLQTAYTDAAGRAIPNFTELFSGNISGKTLVPGLYKWSTGVSVDNTGVTLSGGPNAVWIFQISGDLNLANNGHMTLAGGARASNVFWQVGGPAGAVIGTGAVFQGNILSAKQVILNTGASLIGRALALTDVTLQSTSVTTPGKLVNGVPAPVPPTVTSTVPATAAIGVPIGNSFTATFSEAMDPTTITPLTFTLQNGVTPIAGTVSYSGVTAVFAPLAGLTPGSSYTATITTGAKDPAGVALAANYVWNFTTAAVPDTTRPTVTSASPNNGASNVALGNTLTATFSKAMNPFTISNTTFTLAQGNTLVAGAVSYTGVTATFTPAASLSRNVAFTATITTGAKDLAGNTLASNYVWSFTTGATADTVRPTIISTVPAYNANSVTTTTNLVANFSKSMNPLSIGTATFLLQQGTTQIPGTVTYAGTSATFRPAINLAPNTLFTATITTGVADLAGNALAANYVWNFTTGSSADQTPICLANFAVLSGTAIISTGSTAITGDIGISPGASLSGFPPATLIGTTHAGDSAAAQGILDLSAAYRDAVSRSVGAVSVAGDLGGQTLTAGLYNSTSALSISSGSLTLDAKGDANAVFVFQMASTLSTAAGNQVILANGARAFNVFWQVGTSATLGANSVFQGSILANQSVTLSAGAAVNGRLLAQNGAVTLQSNIITSPPPTIAVAGIFNAASDAHTVAAGSIASAFGNNFGSSVTSTTGYPLPTILGGSSFEFGTQSAPLYMTSCSQANLQVPWEAAGQTQVRVTATVGGLVSTQETVTVAPFAPGIFSLNQLGTGQGAVEIAPTSQLAAPLGAAGEPVKHRAYIAIFCTGLGAVSNQPPTGAAALSNPLSYTLALPTVTIGGVAAQVTYSGLAPGFAGLYQVNAVVPDAVLSGDSINLVLNIGGVQSNTVTIAIQ